MTTPRVFISYARRDGSELAAHLRQQLTAAGIALWLDRVAMEGGRDWWLQITEALDNVEFMVLLVTPGALESEIVRKEWRYARQQGVCVYPIKTGAVQFDHLPRWMRDVHWYDLDQEWDKFVLDLTHPCETPRVPFMVEDLPPDFVARPHELNDLTQHLVDSKGDPCAITAALRGAGGYGKTTLAKAICHDERIQTAFDDGILWLTLGETPGDLTAKLLDLIYVLSGERPVELGFDAARTRLRELLADRDVLLVLDDVWNPAHVKPFLELGSRCARLITTRDKNTLPHDTQSVDVDAMQPDEAVQLLCAGLQPAPQRGNQEVRGLAARLGEWALLLKLANGVIRSRVEKGQSVSEALTYVNKALDKRGLEAFDARDPQDRHQAVAKTLGVSLELLHEDELIHYHELAIFPEDIDIPLAALEKLWNLDDFDTESLCERLYDLSLLLDFNLPQRTIRLHDIVRMFLRGNPAILAGLHNRFLDAYGLAVWADLPDKEPYLWDHLAYHLIEAGREEELVRTTQSLPYIAAKAFVRQAQAVEPDLLLAIEVASQHYPNKMLPLLVLKRIFANDGHILNRCKSRAEALITLHSRIQHDQMFMKSAEAFTLPTPRFEAHHPLPDLSHPALVRTISVRGVEVMDCAVSPDASWIVGALSDGLLKTWQTVNGTEDLILRGHESCVNCCSISPDGQWIVSGSKDITCKVWEAATGKEKLTFRRHHAQIQSCAISPDSRWVATTSDDSTLRVWELLTGKEIFMVKGHVGRVWGCAISPDGTRIATVAEDELLKIWDAATGEERLAIETQINSRRGCEFSPDGRWIASPGENCTVKTWDAHTGEVAITMVGHKAVARGCTFSSDGKLIATSGSDSTVRLWENGTRLATLTGHGGRVWSCAICPDQEWLVSASGDGTLKIWNIQTAIKYKRERFVPHSRGVRGCAISPDGTWIVTASSDNTLKIWDYATQDERGSLTGHTGFANACAISPDATWIVSAGADHRLKIWDVATQQEKFSLQGHRGKVQACVISPDGKLVISAAYDDTIRLWDAQTGQELRAFRGHRSHIQTCAVHPEGKFIASSGRDHEAKLWDLEGNEVMSFRGHEGNIWGSTFTPDGQQLITASWDETLKIWNLQTGACMQTLIGHRGPVRDCAVSPDGRLLASVSNDRTVKIWSMERGVCLGTLYVDGEMLGCAWHPDGVHLVATGRGGVYFLKWVE